MLKFFAKLVEWLLKNGVQKTLMGAGLGVVSYLTVLVAIRAAFDQMINSVYSAPSSLLNLMGIFGIDYVLSSFISVAIFLLTLNSGKLAIRKM